MIREQASDLAEMRELTLLAAASSHTNESAGRALAEFGFSPTVAEALRRFGFLVEAGREWRIEPDLRSRAIGVAVEHPPNLWHQVHAYYLGVAQQNTRLEYPLYLISGPGIAFHGTEVDPVLGNAAYRALAHVDSLEISLTSLRLADEQAARGVLDDNDPAVVFLRGMTLYRMGQRSDAIALLRRVAALDERTREVAVAQHLVGHWDCLQNGKGDPGEARRMLKKSQTSAVLREDRQHLAHVKHTMALCLLARFPGRRIDALKLLRESLSLAEEAGDVWGQAKVMHSLGQALAKERSTQREARQLLVASLAIGAQLGYRRHQASVKESLDSVNKRIASSVAGKRRGPNR